MPGIAFIFAQTTAPGRSVWIEEEASDKQRIERHSVSRLLDFDWVGGYGLPEKSRWTAGRRGGDARPARANRDRGVGASAAKQ